GTQGISAGWSDTYAASIPGQDIDISGLPDGRYAIKTTVDPDRRLIESDDDNNTSTTYVALSGTEIQILASPSAP
ncbi:MAG TPA: lysyl oxidase family protein, partial [Dehalococcoidia bacterium]